MSSQLEREAKFLPLSVLFFIDGFKYRQLAIFGKIHQQSGFINYLTEEGAQREGDWYKFRKGSDPDVITKAIKRAREEYDGEVYHLPLAPGEICETLPELESKVGGFVTRQKVTLPGLRAPRASEETQERLLANLQPQRRVKFTSATSDELEQLAQACQPATSGRNDETIVRDLLLSGTDSLRKLKVELYKLNFCGQAAFFKPHFDTPRSEKIFGSLVLVFPTPHEGGALLHLAAPPSSIGYAAFFSDVEHEVAPVLSGHRITLAYNLYFDDEGCAASVPEPASPLQAERERNICAAFEALLGNPIFLPDGGILGFGLRHVYQFKEDIGPVRVPTPLAPLLLSSHFTTANECQRVAATIHSPFHASHHQITSNSRYTDSTANSAITAADGLFLLSTEPTRSSRNMRPSMQAARTEM
ncbi:hypothetical protein BC826DRAFT_1185681 [Russula brevipes]|nr:hypothetical protein BC826DRAFT_1185681 [Russula brevipes]